MTAGSQFPLCVWDDFESSWAQTDIIATVAPDGSSFSASVTHFSIFGGFAGGNDGLLGDIDEGIITSHINVTLPRENNAFAADSGSEDWGEGLPMFYSNTVTEWDESK